MKKMYEEVSKGTKEDFNQLYQRYRPIVYKLQKKYYLKDFDQEDWLQEGRIIFYRSLEKYEALHNHSIGQLFKKNFENHIRSLLRKQYAVKRTADTQATSLEQKLEKQGEALFHYGEKQQENALDRLIIREKLEEFPTMLSSFEYATFKEYIKGKKIDEIAKVTGDNIRSVKSAYSRVKNKLKNVIYE